MSVRRIMIVSDAWTPQMNGVVRTLQMTRTELERRGFTVAMLTPDLFASLPCPTYPEIRLALASRNRLDAMISEFAPDAIHISTEGPLGLRTRAWCLRQQQPFTTAYHTQFPDYVAARTGLPPALVWRYIRWFHSRSERVLTATPSIRDELRAHGLTRLGHWGRGVDLALFHPRHAPHAAFADLPRPVMLYVGRVAVEKNIAAFLACRHPGSKVVVGDGPALAQVRAAHPDVHFTGRLSGEALAAAYCGADVFVFPSRTDTFGLVLIEAMACGTPVAAYPVTGPRDIVTPVSGALADDLDEAIVRALTCDRDAVAAAGARHNWQTATDQFVAALVPSWPKSTAPAKSEVASCAA